VKVMALTIVALALVIGIVPQFTHCDAMKMAGTASTAGGATMSSSMASMNAPAQPAATIKVPKCTWAARAEIAVAVPLCAVGILMFVYSRRRDALRVLGVSGMAMGTAAILLPTALIGTCVTSSMICNTAFKPTMFVAGGLTVILSLAVLVANEIRSAEPVVTTRAGEMSA